MAKTCEILIVGAGPSGLALASDLSRRGVKFRIVDKNEARSDKSKALGVQARTLEMVQLLLGRALADQMVQSGQPARAINMHLDRAKPIRIEFGQDIQSAYPYILILAQSETERILEEDLAKRGVRVERKTEFLGFTQDEEGVTAQLGHADGTIETVMADYLVGCDGAHSAVRHALAIPFDGAPYDGNFLLGDVYLEWPYNVPEVRVILSEHGAMACFPLPEKNRYRLILIPLSATTTENPQPLELPEFAKAVQNFSPFPIRVYDPVWLTRFRVHHRIVSQFSVGRVFLTGDAAHIHSPVGGQGMNTGIQDSFNLGWKLARVLKGETDAEILDTYSNERMPVASGVVNGTDRAFRLALTKYPAIVRKLRNWILPKILAVRVIRKFIVSTVAEIKICYSSGPLISAEKSGSQISSLDPRFQDLDPNKYTLFTTQNLGTRFDPKQVKLVQVRANPTEPDCVLVRPDGYIALFQKNLDLSKITAMLDRYAPASRPS